MALMYFNRCSIPKDFHNDIQVAYYNFKSMGDVKEAAAKPNETQSR